MDFRIQWGLLVICVVHLVQAVIGFIAEPSFAVGPGAPTVQILGMDYNGWHAVAGLALFGPGLVFCLRNSWAVLPNNITDAIVHFVTAAVMAAVAGIQIRRDGGLRTSLADLRR